MHAYLIIGTDKEALEKKANEIAKKLGLEIFEFPVAKIEDVRNLNRFITLSLSSPTAIFIKNADEATDEALNAFLKNLEEPQDNLFFVLTASNVHKMLPTIVSRCQIIKISSSSETTDEELFLEFLNKDAVERLLEMENLKGREEALMFLENLIFGLHRLLVSNKSDHQKIAEYLKKVQETFMRIKANGNVFLQLTNLTLSLD